MIEVRLVHRASSPSEAISAAAEAERLARMLPEAYEGLVALALCGLARAHEVAGEVEQARPYAAEAVQLYEKVSASSAGPVRGRAVPSTGRP